MKTLLRGKIRWLLIVWIFLIAAITYMDRVNISITGRFIEQEFHLTHIQLGWVFSAFILGYALFQAPGGRLADRYGPARVVAIVVLWYALFTSMTAWTPTAISFALVLLLSVRFLLGSGEACIFPSSNRVVATWIPSQERGLANGIIFAGVGAGAATAPPIISYIIIHYGWRWSFWITALVAICIGVAWFLIARDQPEDHPWMTPEELAHIRAGIPASAPSGSTAVPWGAIFRSKEVLAVSGSYFSFCYVAYLFFSWFFTYLREVRHLNLNTSAIYGMLPFIAMSSCSPLGGWISDRLTSRYGKRIGRCGIALVGLVLTAVFLAIGTQASSAPMACLVLAGGAGALYLSQSSYWSVTAGIAGRSAGSVSGVMNMTGQFGGVVTASLTPLIAAHYGWTASFLVAAALALCGSLAWLLVDPERELTLS
ncbi:MAG: MFS transporter [Bryobacteraceae bacterium]|jgi:ACS family glucarate transporter-like MFS transporter